MPGSPLSLDLARMLEEVRKAGGKLSAQHLENIAARIGSAFRAKSDEVAALRVSPDGKQLRFIFPQKMAKIGQIPITTTNSLAVRTVRGKRGDIVNNFSTYKHPTVFEAVQLASEETSAPIRKIMSAPMLVDNKVVGVIQVSRKGRPGEAVGGDFTPGDLKELTDAAAILGQFLSSES